MEERHMDMFARLCSHSIGGKSSSGYYDVIPFVYGVRGSEPESPFVDNGTLAVLGDLGLIRFMPGMVLQNQVVALDESPIGIVIDGESFAVEKGEHSEIAWAQTQLTVAGEELAKCFPIGCAEGFRDYVVQSIESSGCIVRRSIEGETIKVQSKMAEGASAIADSVEEMNLMMNALVGIKD